MKDTLKLFTTTDLRTASHGLLDKLGLKYSPGAKTQLDIHKLFSKLQLPKATVESFGIVSGVYFVAQIDDRSFVNNSNTVEIDTAISDAKDEKYNGMFVFALQVNPDANVTRTMLANLTRAFNRYAARNPVALFIQQGNLLSLSTCERTSYAKNQQYRDGEKLGKVSLLRNIDCLNPHRGHRDILMGMECSGCATFDKLYEKWQKVFNSELLTKQFYNDLFEWYQWAVSDKAHISFPCDFEQKELQEDKETRIIRLITRLMFVWFIKQKDLVPAKIFNEDHVATILKDFNSQSETEGNYYQAILQNLFFGTLNRPVIEDGEYREFAKASRKDAQNLYRYAELFSINEDEVIDLFSTVPFLNCGLFECQDKTRMLDGVERRYYYDGFSRNNKKEKEVYRYRAVIPNVLFFHPSKGIISIFNRYVFTIEENTPQDVQVALDPELLGKVFENLLGAYNPETKETARNESGSFYTPREIVQYMVNESLVAHLKQTVGEELEPQYRQLLDFTTENVSLTDEQKTQILHSLFTCKILDPACGSGAFPMGMLQQMVHILQQVDPDNTQWRDILLNMAVDESRRAFGIVDEEERKKKLREIEETFNNGLNSPDYTRKLYIIESCIYGVDIQPIAMLISRLRFFITLICEQNDIQRDKPEINFGIKTLPNLESKFVAANSLINADIHKYNEDWTQDEVLALLKNELIAIRRRHFYTRKRSEKIRLLKEDEAKRKQIHEHINRLVGEPNEAKIASLQQQIADNEKLLEMYQGEDWVEEAVQKDLFSEPQIIRVDRNKRERDRINSVISACRRDIEHEQNKCTPQGFEAAVLQVTDWNPYDQNSVSPFLDIEWMFGVTDGFDIVIGNPPYVSVKAISSEDKAIYSGRFKTGKGRFNLFTLFLELFYEISRKEGSFCLIIPEGIYSNIEYRFSRELLVQQCEINRLCTFTKRVFEASVDTTILLILKKEEMNEQILIDTDIKQTTKSLSQKDIARTPYYLIPVKIEGRNKELVEKLLLSPKFDRISDNLEIQQGIIYTGQAKEDVFADYVKDSTYKPILDGRDVVKWRINWDIKEYDKFLSYTNKLHRPREERLFLAEKKILLPRRATKIVATIDYQQFYALNTAYICLNKENKYETEFLLGIMNSKIVDYFYSMLFMGWQITIPALEVIPIPCCGKEKQLEVCSLVKKTIEGKRNDPSTDTSALESEIDLLVYHLYGLTYDEVLIVDPETPITREEYESNQQ